MYVSILLAVAFSFFFLISTWVGFTNLTGIHHAAESQWSIFWASVRVDFFIAVVLWIVAGIQYVREEILK